MKTAMQELIEIIEKVDGDFLNKEYLLNTLNYVFIEKEKWQIINANQVGWQACRRDINQNAQDYYNETFTK